MQCYVQTPTGNLKESLDFYFRLGFEKLEVGSENFVTDGKVLIQINEDRFARAGVVMHRASWTTLLPQLKHHTHITEITGGYLIGDSSGCRIYLKEGDPKIKYARKEASFSILGNYAGVSLESSDMLKSVALWEILGFKKTMGGVDQGWIAFENAEKFGVSIMKPNSCPHLFFNPSLTYFNGGKNLPVIEKIREAGITITEEITHFNKEGIVDNVILRDPGGYGFFVFND